MLGKRLVTASILVFILLIAVFFFNAFVFSVFLSAVTLIGVWEWSSLAGFKSTVQRSLYCLIFSGAGLLAYLYLQEYFSIVLIVSLCFWILAFFMIGVFPRMSSSWARPAPLSVIGILVLLPCWLALLYLRNNAHFAFHFLSLIALVAAADSGAYFFGKYLGRRKLAVLVSPNKTWEGVFGGLLACAMVTVIFSLGYGFVYSQAADLIMLFLLPFVISFFSVVGDLFESMVKRVRGVKDSGSILPGHGGILDRIDGIVAAVPVYILILFYFT
tara:strand:- start:290 stop:1105 length:816 start_codon:yes stop_codon:yes gene_type:complete